MTGANNDSFQNQMMIMRNTCLLIFLFCCFGSLLPAQEVTPYPTITIPVSDNTVEIILEEITRQSGRRFSFNPQTVDVERIISFSVTNATLEKTLDALSERLGISYILIDDQIILKRPERDTSDTDEIYTLSGFIEDQLTGESLIGATAAVPGTSLGAVTNAFGYYALPLRPDEYRMQYSYVGYDKKVMDLSVTDDEQRNILMEPTAIELPNVIVELPVAALLKRKSLDHPEFKPGELNLLPEFAGESGLVKGLQTLPGIKMHSDGSAFFYVRGGDRDQNLIIIDDAPIYNPSHLFGFYSIVIPDFAKSIQVYKGDFPANLGDRLSSIIDIRTRDGNLNRFELRGAVNPLINRFSLESPIVKKRGSLFLSWRRSNFEWLYQKAAPEADLGFGDFNFKINYKLNDHNRLFFTTIFSGDNFTNTAAGTQAGIRWANLAATFRWNHIFSPKLFSNTTLYTGNYGYRLFFSPNYWQSALGSLSFKTDFTHYARPGYTARFGLEWQAYFIDPGSFALDTTIAILPSITPNYSRKSVLYYQADIDLTETLKLRAGARLINWSNLGPATYYRFDEQYEVRDTVQAGEGVYNRYFNFDPRLSLQYQWDKRSQLKLSLGRYHQYLQLISNSLSPFNSLEVWLPAGPTIRPQSVIQTALTYLTYLPKPGLSLSASLYYKHFNDQIDYEEHAVTLLNPLIEGELRFGSMRSYGLELLLKKEAGRLSGWLGYTYSRALRRTPDLNDDRTYPAFQDRPHDLSLVLNYRPSSRLFLSAYWTAYSGSPFSSPTGFYRFNEQTVPIYDDKNNDRLPQYRRLDLSLQYRLNKDETRRFQHSLTFSIYNALAHKNVVAITFNRIPLEGGRPVVKTDLLSGVPLSPTQADLIRFFPSLTYKFKL